MRVDRQGRNRDGNGRVRLDSAQPNRPFTASPRSIPLLRSCGSQVRDDIVGLLRGFDDVLGSTGVHSGNQVPIPFASARS
jgi:hypothetical protein